MSEEEREESEKAIVAGVIAAGVAVQAAVAGAAVAAGQPTSAPSSLHRLQLLAVAEMQEHQLHVKTEQHEEKHPLKLRSPLKNLGRIRRIRLRRPK
jgi:hypothetical protein